MVVAQLTDPVLSVQRRYLVEGVGVVVEAEVVGGKTVQPLINNARRCRARRCCSSTDTKCRDAAESSVQSVV